MTVDISNRQFGRTTSGAIRTTASKISSTGRISRKRITHRERPANYVQVEASNDD